MMRQTINKKTFTWINFAENEVEKLRWFCIFDEIYIFAWSNICASVVAKVIIEKELKFTASIISKM